MTETWSDRFLKKSKQRDEKLVEPIDARIKPGSLMTPRKEISSLEKFPAKSFLSVRAEEIKQMLNWARLLLCFFKL